MQELWGLGGFPSDFKGRSGRQEVPQTRMCGAVIIKSKVKKQSWEAADVRNVDHKPRKAAGSKWHQLKREDLWAAPSKAMGLGPHCSLELTFYHHVPQMPDRKRT